MLGVVRVTPGRRHAETLAPAIEFCCEHADIALDEISVVAVDIGPGLFTGLRVGLATAKAIAHALRVPMIGISSLDLLAFPLRHASRVIATVIDARRGELFYAFYRQVPGGVQRLSLPVVGTPDDLVADIYALGDESSASATARCATATQLNEVRGVEFAERGWPTRRPRRSCSSPTPRRCARTGSTRGSSSRSTSASPTPRSTGRLHGAGQPMSITRRALVLPDPADLHVRIAPMKRRHLRPVMRIEQQVYPRPWSLGVFHGELGATDGTRCYVVARVDGAVVGYAGVLYSSTGRPRHQRRRRPGPAPPQDRHPPAAHAGPPGPPAGAQEPHARGAGQQPRRPGDVPRVRVRARSGCASGTTRTSRTPS